MGSWAAEVVEIQDVPTSKNPVGSGTCKGGEGKGEGTGRLTIVEIFPCLDIEVSVKESVTQDVPDFPFTNYFRSVAVPTQFLTP